MSSITAQVRQATSSVQTSARSVEDLFTRLNAVARECLNKLKAEQASKRQRKLRAGVVCHSSTTASQRLRLLGGLS
jgi:hypothetical protein